MEQVSITITLNQRLADELRCVAEPRDAATYVGDMVRQHLQAIRLKKLLKEMDDESGPIPPEIQAEVDCLPWPD